LTGVRLLLVGLLAATLTSHVAGQERRDVVGHVRSATDSAPLAGVRIHVVEVTARTESGLDGRFAIGSVPIRDLHVVFERIGVVPDTVLLPADLRTLDVYLSAQPVQISPLIAVGERPARERFENLAQTSTVSLDPAIIRNAPTLAEPDVARTVQLLPGTVAKNDFTVGLNVRGGENDQNLIRLDGVTVFNPFHIGGVFGTFDAAAIQQVDFITGGFPAGYGGRLSSVLDVRLRPGSRARTHVQGAVSLLAARLMVDGPIGNTGATYLVGARRSYTDAIADFFFEDEEFRYHFGDAVGKLTVPLGAGSISAHGYLGNDVLVLEWISPEPGREGADVEFSWGNRLGGLTFRYPLGSAQFEQHVSVSAFDTKLALVPNILDIDNSVRQFTARTSLGVSLGSTHDLHAGVGVESNRMEYDYRSEALEVQALRLTYRPTLWSAFLDDQWRPFHWLLLRPGVRVDYVSGGADFTAVAPRVAMKVFLTSDLALTGSAGRYYQALHSIRDQELPVTLFDFWIGADDVTPVSRSDHAVLGFERWFGNALSLSVEGYLKSFYDLTLRNRADDPKVRGDEFIVGDGDAYGFDVLLRKHAGSIRGWVAYSFAKAKRTAGGEEFPPAHDRGHTLNIVVEMPGPLGSEMGVRWGYGSPIPYTGITGQWLHRQYNAEMHLFEEPEDEVLSTSINGERFPHYHRLDASFRWRFEWLGGIWRPYLQVVNAYNRQNVFVYLFDYTKTPATRSGYSQLPIFPTIGIEFEW